jgi:hypothetical protein
LLGQIFSLLTQSSVAAQLSRLRLPKLRLRRPTIRMTSKTLFGFFYAVGLLTFSHPLFGGMKFSVKNSII